MADEKKDLIITCVDCGKDFLYPVGEQIYFASKNLLPPKRCFACRKKRKEEIAKQKHEQQS